MAVRWKKADGPTCFWCFGQRAAGVQGREDFPGSETIYANLVAAVSPIADVIVMRID